MTIVYMYVTDSSSTIGLWLRRTLVRSGFIEQYLKAFIHE